MELLPGEPEAARKDERRESKCNLDPIAGPGPGAGCDREDRLAGADSEDEPAEEVDDEDAADEAEQAAVRLAATGE